MSALHYLALGDSYTCGEGVAADASWPAQLARTLRGDGIDVAPPRIIAVTGWTTRDLAAALDAAAPLPAQDLVSLQIGVNNQYRGEAAEAYRPDVAALLARAVALVQGRAERVLAVSIPDWGRTPFARSQGRDAARVARELDVYNAIARDAARRAGARWIDVTAISRDLEPGWIGADDLHPSAAQYAAWLDVIAPAARAALA